MVFWDHVTNQKHFIFTSTMPETTKSSRVVSKGEGIPTIKSHDHLKEWLCEITWQIKNNKYDLPQCLLLPNLSAWWLTARGSDLKVTWLFNQVVLWFWFSLIRFIGLEGNRLNCHRLLINFVKAGSINEH